MTTMSIQLKETHRNEHNQEEEEGRQLIKKTKKDTFDKRPHRQNSP